MDPDNSIAERKEIYHPKIGFVIDPDADVCQIRWRINDSSRQAVKDFIAQAVESASSKDEACRIAELNIRRFYNERADEIRARVEIVKADWMTVEHLFYKEVVRLFSCYPWPRPPEGHDRYIGNSSILGRWPRYISKKTFSFPANPSYPYTGHAVKVIAHEMLHFMEYEYMEKKFGLRSSERNAADNTFWQFTENLNVLIESSDPWKVIRHDFVSRPYPECQELYDRMKDVWDNSQSVDILIHEIFKEQLVLRN